MIMVDEKTAIVGVAELRDDIAKVLKEVKSHKVILTRRNKPVGVIIDYPEFERMRALEEELENLVLGLVAKERAARKGRKTVTLEEAERLLGIR